ncbi:MAG: transcriptional regulator [Devosia sp. 67-54]|uniref:transcriptional regulator n=1 Tax=unclassified Devosia TaxID=196773 RepID=UPI0008693A30|nr:MULTISPECIES: transcriptional regulator [unclassified Devosia]MBN9303739.1 transcriptional regulator [Devosia sp.]ODU62348.1 MAG: transcriptional regulator [Pelagibacterium sp. SCN 68-10]OJX17613.1 MAG: transcriptional regulator [Devosia sp. 67-54]
MPLTREFKDTVQARAKADAAFRAALLSEVIDLFLAGDMATGKSVLRDYINATIGFATLADVTGVPAKSLMRMVSASGNPRADNLFAIISALQDATGVQLSVSAAA